MSKLGSVIDVGDYIIIQRQSYAKLHKLKANGTVSLGKDQVELEKIIGKQYYSTFRMVVKPRNKRVYTLEEADYVRSIQNLSIDKSGVDNRNIIDDGSSQQLSTEEIHKFRDDALSSSDIVEKLVTNSKTFVAKTEYSQEKYLKKKEKKYFEYVQILKPTLRLIAKIYYMLDPGKIQGIRIDDLSQILSYANIHSDSNVLLYDSGTSGLLPAAITNALGKNTMGSLIHMHPGNVCQKEAFLALQFPSEQSERCINVCLYSVLRCFYQEFIQENDKINEIIQTADPILTAEIIQTADPNENINPKENTGLSSENIENTIEQVKLETITDSVNNKRKLSIDETEKNKDAKRPRWQFDNEKACKILSNKVDSVIVVAKEHPSNIVIELLSFLKYGKPFVIFSLLREPLQSLYVDLKNHANYMALRLSNNLLRNYQILENRTHPDVNMTCGGYILTGFKIDIKESE